MVSTSPLVTIASPPRESPLAFTSGTLSALAAEFRLTFSSPLNSSIAEATIVTDHKARAPTLNSIGAPEECALGGRKPGAIRNRQAFGRVIRRLAQCSFVFLIALQCLSAHADVGCTIVNGRDWSFMFLTPENWASSCAQDKLEVNVALWPETSTWRDAPVVMYINMSRKDGLSLQQFAEDELSRSRAESPSLSVKIARPIPMAKGKQALVWELANDRLGNHELIAFADGGTVYLIIALASHVNGGIDEFRSTFQELVSSLIPVKVDAGQTPDPRK
jgi:hypothetical protein